MPRRGMFQALAMAGWPLLIWAGAFGIAHTQCPLYFSNQNQYFLHGLAEGGLGFLERDWLVKTHDPTPVFSAGVALTYRYLDVSLFYVYYFIVLAVYFCSLAAITAVLPGPPLTGLARFFFLTLLVAVHAAILRVGSVYAFDVDYPWYLQSGIANQYVLGPGLQPSAFGVLLIASVVAFARGRPLLATGCASAAAIVHATYLLPAAFFMATYVALLCRAGRWRIGLLLGAGSLGAVLPIVIYSLRMFAASTPEEFAEAQRILVEIRIPHHANVRQWLDEIAVGQLGWIVLALFLVRRSILFPLLTFPTVAGLALTLVQVATGSHTLALLFPWRISSVVMPVATAVILARLAAAAGPWLARRPALQWGCLWFGCAGVLAAVVAGGVVVSWYGLGYQADDRELQVMEYVRKNQQAGDVCLLPVRIPAVGSGRGAVSTTFKPPQEPHLIRVDLQRFRLVTGAPIYVDFKSIPYKDVDVLSWYQRMQLCQAWYDGKCWNNPALCKQLADAGVTHVLIKADQAIDSAALQFVYGDNLYRLYRLHPPSRGDTKGRS
jgi:hypothetical protein